MPAPIRRAFLVQAIPLVRRLAAAAAAGPVLDLGHLVSWGGGDGPLMIDRGIEMSL